VGCWSVVDSLEFSASWSLPVCTLAEAALAMALTRVSLLLSEGDSDLGDSELELRFSVVRDAGLIPVGRGIMSSMTSAFQSSHRFTWEAKDAELLVYSSGPPPGPRTTTLWFRIRRIERRYEKLGSPAMSMMILVSSCELLSNA
jgi:hypothetical protein